MSVQIEVVCDRCKAVAEGSITQRGTIRPDAPGWRYVSRDTNLCPSCSDDFEVWRNAGPRQPVLLTINMGGTKDQMASTVKEIERLTGIKLNLIGRAG